MVTLIKYGALSGGEKYNINQMWIDGLSTDSKPATTIEGMPIPNGSVYTEVDTGKTYMFDKDNTTWHEVSLGGGGGGGGGFTPTQAQLDAMNSGIDSEKVAQIETNKTNISNNTAEINGQQNATTDTVAGRGYAIINGKRLYMTDSQPTDGRQGDKWIDGNAVKTYSRTDNIINPDTVLYGYYINANGEIVQSTAVEPENRLNLTDYIAISADKYTVSGNKNSGVTTAISFSWFDSSRTFIQRDSTTFYDVDTSYSVIGTPVANAVYMRVNYMSSDGKPMLNAGDTALPYEPYLQWE